VLLTSVTLFACGSLACALAGSMPALVAARALQGLGGGGLMTLTMLATAALFPLPERGRRLGALGAAYGLSTLVGPLGGALLLQALPWTWAFWLNLPGTLVALAVLWRAEVGQAHPRQTPPDWLGAALLSAALITLLLATRGGQGVWMAGLAAALSALWWAVERRAADPVVPLVLFTRRPFRIAALLALLSGTMLFAAVVFVPLFLQQGLGLTPLRAALATLPLMLGITVGGQISGRALRGGVSLARVSGFAAIGLKLGFAALALVLLKMPAQGALPTAIAVALALLPAGLGLGLLFPLVSVVSQRSAPPQQQGVATATPVMLRALGGSLGVAMLGELLRSHMAGAAVQGLHSQQDAMLALAGGTARIAGIAAGVAVLAFGVSRGLAAVERRAAPGGQAAAPAEAAAPVAASMDQPARGVSP
jgi:MFS family permease